MGKGSRERRRLLKEMKGGAEPAPPSSVVQDGIDADLIAQPAPPPSQPLRATPRSQAAQLVMQEMTYSAPIPPPSIMKGYEEVLPGSAGRIMTQFEEQGRHRRKIENRVVWSNVVQSTLGQVLAFVLFMTMVVGGGYLAYQGKQVAGLGAIASAVVGGVWVLVKAESAKKKDAEEKRDSGKRVARR